MRIVQFSDSFLPIMDGVGNVVYHYALNLGEKGHDCYVVAPQTNTGFRGRYPFEIVDYIGVPLPLLKSYKLGAPLLDPHCHNRLAMLEADVVHVHSPFVAGQLGVGFAQKRGLPLVGTFHSKYYDDFLQVTGVELLAEVGVKYVVNFYEKCDEVWAVSQSSAETLHGYGYEGPIRVMPNGTDIHAVPPGKADEARERYGLTDAPLLLYAGQINWKKNLRCTLEACARLPGDFQLVLAGQGPHEAEVRALAARLGFSKKLRLTGHLCDAGLLNALYGLADLFVFPSLYDTSGLVVREAAAMGTPSVVVADSSAAEGIADGENGYLCENDPESLADAIQRALGDREGLRAVGERAKATIPIPWSRLVDDVLARYAELAGRR